MNGLKHGRRSKRLALMADMSYSVEERRMKWMAAHDASNDMEEYIIARNAVIASKLDRIERADVEGFQSCVENFDAKEREEALALVGRLFHNRWGSAASYGISPRAPNGPTISFSAQPVEVEEPAAIVEKLETSECGTRILLDTWDSLREQLEPGKFWQSPDRFRAIRLLKHQPADAREDRDVAAVFYASARLEPWRRKPFRELRSDFSPRELTELRDEVADRFPELEKLKEPDECRAVLFEIIDRNIERLEEVLAAHEEDADAQAKRVVAREGFDTSPRAKQLNDFEIRYTNVLYRGMRVYKEMTGGKRRDGGRRAEDGGGEVPPSHGAGPEGCRAATIEPVDGTRRVPATTGGAERGWESVKVEAADVLACQGFLPEGYTGGASATAALPLSEEDAASSVSGAPEADACGDAKLVAAPDMACETVTNEPNCDHDVITIQHEESVEVVANPDAFSGLDTRRTNPTPAGGAGACGIGGLHDPTAPTSKEQERRRTSRDRMWRESMRLLAAKGVGARERTRTLDAGVTSGGAAGRGAEEPMVSPDGRGP